MGTSISQPSPRKSNWKRVFVCYESNNLPEERVVNEVWRASENPEPGEQPLSADMKSATTYECYRAVQNSKTALEAMQKYTEVVRSTKSNSIVAEFAKRAIAGAFQSYSDQTISREQKWASNFFKEVTNYIISRDASGFVGKDYRNKSVKELIQFKLSLGEHVIKVVESDTDKLKSKADWEKFVNSSIGKLKSTR